MAVFIGRLDTVPVLGNDFTFEFNQWLANTIDVLNEALETIQDSFNVFDAPSYTALKITALQTDGELDDGVVLFDTTNNVYVGRISGVLVKFTTAAYP